MIVNIHYPHFLSIFRCFPATSILKLILVSLSSHRCWEGKLLLMEAVNPLSDLNCPGVLPWIVPTSMKTFEQGFWQVLLLPNLCQALGKHPGPSSGGHLALLSFFPALSFWWGPASSPSSVPHTLFFCMGIIKLISPFSVHFLSWFRKK